MKKDEKIGKDELRKRKALQIPLMNEELAL